MQPGLATHRAVYSMCLHPVYSTCLHKSIARVYIDTHLEQQQILALQFAHKQTASLDDCLQFNRDHIKMDPNVSACAVCQGALYSPLWGRCGPKWLFTSMPAGFGSRGSENKQRMFSSRTLPRHFTTRQMRSQVYVHITSG